MAEPDNTGDNKAFLARYGEVNAELNSLEGKADQESNERRAELLEELMCMDMALGPCRRAMSEKARKKREQEGMPSDPRQQVGQEPKK